MEYLQNNDVFQTIHDQENRIDMVIYGILNPLYLQDRHLETKKGGTNY